MSDGVIFSIIIDTYNYGEYVEDAIVSALQQTLPRKLYEIIVVDDGSTDNTRQRVAKYLPEVIYHYKENGGQASAFNAGLALARGEFIAFLDADDYWHPDKLKRVLEAFMNDVSVDVVYHKLSLVDHAGTQRGVFPQCFDKMTTAASIENCRQWVTVIGSCTSGIIWRADAIRALLPVPEDFRICADGYLMVGAPLIARKFGIMNTSLGYYRIHGQNCYSTFSASGATSMPKTHEVEAHYHALFCDHFARLVERFGRRELRGFAKDMSLNKLRMDLAFVRQRSGIFRALLKLWLERSQLRGLPLRYCLFRTGTLLTQALVSPGMYLNLYNIYAQSMLWRFIHRYVKNGSLFLKPEHGGEHP